MRPVLSQLLCDNESLLDYERDDGADIPFPLIRSRLIAVERQRSPLKNDSYYEGLGERMLEDYASLSQILWQLPYDLAHDCLYGVYDKVYVKAERFDGWMESLCHFPPLYLVAGYFLDCFSTPLLLSSKTGMTSFRQEHLNQFKYSAQVLPYIQELNFLIQKEGGLNDLHIHLNGSTESDAVWSYMLRHPLQTFRDFSKAYHEKNGKTQKQAEQLFSGFTPECMRHRLMKARQLRNELMRSVLKNNGLLPEITGWKKYTWNVRSIWETSLNNPQNSGDLIDELILYLLIMDELRKNDNSVLAAMFHHYLLIKGVIHRFVVMQHSQKGFSQFQLLTENSLREDVEKDYKQRFMQLGGGTMKYLGTIEGRFSPKDSSSKIYQQVNRIRRGFDKAQKENEYLADCELSLIAHFIKKPEKETYLPIQHRSLRKEFRKKAMALATLLKRDPKCRSLVQAIDAAASEFDVKPEVFAPIFRFLRTSGIRHFTFHVGEDFNHPLSGLRVIREAICFLELQAGDRLGHCTALGINPELWVRRIGEYCYMSRIEWLDNLVFAWMLIEESRHPQLQTLRLTVESEIHKYTELIYGEAYSPFSLADQWKLRKYDPFVLLDSEKSMNEYGWTDVESIYEIEQIRGRLSNERIKKLYEQYHSSSKSRKEQGFNKIEKVSTTAIFRTEDIEIMQQLILAELSQKGIVIEALPTSNMRISYYKHLKEYHLASWLNEDTEQYLRPFVVLGTDDPGIFATNIYNEYARAYLHMQECGCTSSERLRKITEIHEWSNIYKFVNND